MFAALETSDIAMFVCIGWLAGWLAGEFRKGEGYGLLANAVVGVLGAVLGSVLFEIFEIEYILRLGLPDFIQTTLSAFVGAVVLLFCLDRIGMKT